MYSVQPALYDSSRPITRWVTLPSILLDEFTYRHAPTSQWVVGGKSVLVKDRDLQILPIRIQIPQDPCMVRVYLHLIHFYDKSGWIYYTWILWEHSHKLANWFSNQKSDFQALPCSNFLMLLHHYCCCCSGYVWPLAQIARNNKLNCLFLFSIGV